jgi:hypothetical protein
LFAAKNPWRLFVRHANVIAGPLIALALASIRRL